MIEEGAPALDRVKTVLGQRERARSSGGPGIDQAHLDTVEMVINLRRAAARPNTRSHRRRSYGRPSTQPTVLLAPSWLAGGIPKAHRLADGRKEKTWPRSVNFMTGISFSG